MEAQMQEKTQVKRRRTVGSGTSLKEPAASQPHEHALCRRLSRVEAVHAVYLATDDEGTIHVYSVVPDYCSDLYDKLLKQERLVEKQFPQLTFEFHVRAHQGRQPHGAVPFGSRS